MGARYLTDLAAVVRAAGLVAVEEGGWQTRARSSGGYDSGRPNHVMVHHTASNPSSDGQGDVNYCCYGSSDAPLCNLYVGRDGRVWVLAAGATNTNGKGHDPCGTTPDDSMNSSAVGIEVANTGVGEPYPDAQQRAVATLVRALCDAYGVPVGRVHTHYEWAPDRKCDNTGPSRWAPPGTPGGCSGAGAWDMTAFRNDIAASWPEPPPPEPPDEVPMTYILESTVNDSTRGQLVLVDSGRVRSIGGGEKNALGALAVPKYGISSATEWQMILNSRSVQVDVV